MSIIERAAEELRRINFGEEDSARMLEILRLFFGQWDSGGAVACVTPVLMRCLAGKPLSPLTGADDEWTQIQSDWRTGEELFQNKRCSTVFKQFNRAYDIALPRVGRDWQAVTFPYMPTCEGVPMPVVEIEIPDPIVGLESNAPGA